MLERPFLIRVAVRSGSSLLHLCLYSWDLFVVKDLFLRSNFGHTITEFFITLLFAILSSSHVRKKPSFYPQIVHANPTKHFEVRFIEKNRHIILNNRLYTHSVSRGNRHTDREVPPFIHNTKYVPYSCDLCSDHIPRHDTVSTILLIRHEFRI